jgi:hypothetical protein
MLTERPAHDESVIIGVIDTSESELHVMNMYKEHRLERHWDDRKTRSACVSLHTYMDHQYIHSRRMQFANSRNGPETTDRSGGLAIRRKCSRCAVQSHVFWSMSWSQSPAWRASISTPHRSAVCPKDAIRISSIKIYAFFPDFKEVHAMNRADGFFPSMRASWFRGWAEWLRSQVVISW